MVVLKVKGIKKEGSHTRYMVPEIKGITEVKWSSDENNLHNQLRGFKTRVPVEGY